MVCIPAASDSVAPDATQAVSTPPAAAERTGLIPTEQRRAAELEDAFPDDSIVRFGEGSDLAIGVYRESVRGDALGVVVVVLGSGLSPDSYSDSTSLRRSLPRERWSTLTVALPDAPNESLPPRQHDKYVEGSTTGAAPPAEAVPEKAAQATPAATDPMPSRVRARLDAAVKAARAKASKVVILGEDSAGAWVTWAQGQGLGADGVGAINTARNAPKIDGKTPKEALAIAKSPTLLLIETPLDWSVDDRLSRDVALRLLPPGDPSGARLDRQIRAWLKRNVVSRE